jgi:hypothetical protein
MSKPWLTAMPRRGLSAPARWLSEQGSIIGRVIDYGCGRGTDAALLGAAGYDPHWRPDESVLLPGHYDTALCLFVLNVIRRGADRRKVLLALGRLLRPEGVAYIAVRNDRENLLGLTARGTWQGWVTLPFELVKRTTSYRLYRASATDLELSK